jgi:hypothetical protein
MDGAAATGLSSSHDRHIEVGLMDGGAATGGSSLHGHGSSLHGHAEAGPMDGATTVGSSSHGHAQTYNPMHGGSALTSSSLGTCIYAGSV